MNGERPDSTQEIESGAPLAWTDPGDGLVKRMSARHSLKKSRRRINDGILFYAVVEVVEVTD
jgi:hypothetical protein